MGRTRCLPPLGTVFLALLAGCSTNRAPLVPLAWHCADGGMVRVLIEEEQGRPC